MTPASYRTFREGCGLSQQDAAAFHGVSLRTMGHWENGRNSVLPDSVPPGAAQELLDLNAMIERGVHNILTLAAELDQAHGAAEEIVLTRYRTPDDYAGCRYDQEGLPWPCHNAMLARVLVALQRQGRAVTLVYAPSVA